ncbi:MAG: hypothetical protein IJE05_00695 [Clostridia bacterium]|nr:hypothetical protein [Clostridia bacterium]
MKAKHMIVVFSIIAIAFAIIGGSVYASSFKFSVTATKTKLKPGESTVVVMKIQDIVDTNNLGINALESTLEYDTNVLEVVTSSDMSGKNNWTITYNAQGKNFLVSNITSGVKEDQEIGSIKFKVKDNVGKTKTIIKFKNVKSNDGSNLMTESDKQIELTIDGDGTSTSGTGTNGNVSTGNTGNSLISGNKTNDEASVPIPKAGVNGKWVLMICILGVIMILSYAKYRTIDK